jgi:pseudouridine-5'-phosphate glycosidase
MNTVELIEISMVGLVTLGVGLSAREFPAFIKRCSSKLLFRGMLPINPENRIYVNRVKYDEMIDFMLTNRFPATTSLPIKANDYMIIRCDDMNHAILVIIKDVLPNIDGSFSVVATRIKVNV